MMRALTFVSLLLMSHAWVFSQPLFLNAEFGPKADIYKIDDPGGQLTTGPSFYHPNMEISLVYPMTDRFSISGGLLFNTYGESFRLKNQISPLGGGSNVMSTISIPLRLYASLYPWNEPASKFKMGVSLGWHIVFNLDYDTFSSSQFGTFGFGQDLILQTSVQNEETEVFGLLEGGLFMDFQLSKRWILTFTSHYTYGFEDILEANISYSLDSGFSFQNATAVSEGRYYDFHFGVKYRLSAMN